MHLAFWRLLPIDFLKKWIQDCASIMATSMLSTVHLYSKEKNLTQIIIFNIVAQASPVCPNVWPYQLQILQHGKIELSTSS